MKLPLGALLVFVGYAVLWTGYMNVRVVFTANPGGEPKASGKLFSLMDALTCGPGKDPSTASGSAPGGPTDSGWPTIPGGLPDAAARSRAGQDIVAAGGNPQAAGKGIGDLWDWLKGNAPNKDIGKVFG